MINLVIPTDFSPAARTAINYGIALAARLNASVHLFHLIHVESYTHAAAQVHMNMILEKMTENAQHNLKTLAGEIKKSYPEQKIKTICVQGEFLSSAVNSYASENGIDLVVMGTRGASGIIGSILGSNASDVIAKSSIPVLAVPPGTTYGKHPRIILTTDLNNLEPKLRIITPLAAVLGSGITLLHISPDGSHTEKEEEDIRARFSSEFNIKDLRVKIIQNVSIENGIHDFALENQPCILSMFTHKSGFFDKLFGKSVTRKVVFHTEVPLLALKH
ncbi:MAG: universal stress protein [Bacteroidia bacterium]|nr:universal stress protein [Bacteroidia bacterium]